MKAGFKPKLWTRKEWLDAAPSSKTKGCGVDVALDDWQKHCDKPFGDMTLKEAFTAGVTASKLSQALTKASQKCDPKSQKETLAGIFEYKKRADDYAAYAKLAAAALTKREKYAESFKDWQDFRKDPAAWTVFTKFCKSPLKQMWPSMHTLMLFEEKKYEQAVRLYSEDGKGGGDYNIEGKHNRVLYDTFVAKVRHNQPDILAAIKACITGQKEMMSDRTHYGESGVKGLADWKALVEKKFPVKEYKVS